MFGWSLGGSIDYIFTIVAGELVSDTTTGPNLSSTRCLATFSTPPPGVSIASMITCSSDTFLSSRQSVACFLYYSSPKSSCFCFSTYGYIISSFTPSNSFSIIFFLSSHLLDIYILISLYICSSSSDISVENGDIPT